MLALCFRGVDSDELHILAGEFVLPLAVGWVVVDAIAAAEGEEVNDDYAAAEGTRVERLRIEPGGAVADEIGCFEGGTAEFVNVEVAGQ